MDIPNLIDSFGNGNGTLLTPIPPPLPVAPPARTQPESPPLLQNAPTPPPNHSDHYISLLTDIISSPHPYAHP